MSFGNSLERRLGGGAGGGAGGRPGGGIGGRPGGGAGSSGGGGSSGSGGGTGGSSGRGSSISVGGTTKSASSGGRGGGSVSNVPSGQIFSGRSQGGGTRDQVYGTKQYGSGYPGVSGRGVTGRGFPFYFWPVTWGGVAGIGAGEYLHTHEYGLPDNTTRPGGPLYTAAFTSVNSTTNSTFRILSDRVTVTSLVTDINSFCNSSIAQTSSTAPIPYSLMGPPVPEQAVQYYRASSVALTLDGYNNTAVFGGNETGPDVPLPSNTDMGLLNCLNTTIGGNVPLIDAVIVATASGPASPTTTIIFDSGASHLKVAPAANLSFLLLMVLAVFRSLIAV